jgi:hypothetical protein
LQDQLFDDLAGAQQKRLGDGEPDGFGGFEVDDQLEFGRKLYRQVTAPLALGASAPKIAAGLQFC